MWKIVLLLVGVVFLTACESEQPGFLMVGGSGGVTINNFTNNVTTINNFTNNITNNITTTNNVNVTDQSYQCVGGNDEYIYNVTWLNGIASYLCAADSTGSASADGTGGWTNSSIETNTSLDVNIYNNLYVKGGDGKIVGTPGAGSATLLVQSTATGGVINFGNNAAAIGISDDGVISGYNYGGAFILRQKGTDPVENGEFIFIEESGSWRFALPKSLAQLGTYNPRSMIIAGPSTNDNRSFNCSYWGFTSIDCATNVTGADLGVQDDAQIKGKLYINEVIYENGTELSQKYRNSTTDQTGGWTNTTTTTTTTQSVNINNSLNIGNTTTIKENTTHTTITNNKILEIGDTSDPAITLYTDDTISFNRDNNIRQPGPGINYIQPLYNDFFLNVNSWTPYEGTALGSGTYTSTKTGINLYEHPGVLNISTSTTASSGYCINTNSLAINIKGNETGIIMFAPHFKTGNATFIKAGFFDAISASPADTDGVYFNISQTNFTVVTANNSVRTNSTWMYNNLTSGQFYTAIIKLNAGASQANFYLLNDSGSLIYQKNITTTIPTLSGRETAFGFCAYTVGGTTAQGLALLDLLYLETPNKRNRGGGNIGNFLRTI